MTGLSTAEARLRLTRYGPNEPARRDHRPVWAPVVAVLASPLNAVLLLASAVSAVVGDPLNAAIIALMVVLGATLNAVQTHRSGRAIESLRRRVAPVARVLRDGAWVDLPAREVVPGDVIDLEAGDLVPADATVLEARDLHLQQAALTGESLPVEAGPGGRVFLGTSVVSGRATAEVTATGGATEFGHVAALLVRRRPETEFERGSRRFGGLIVRTVLLLVVSTLAVHLALGRDPIESLLFAIALAVGLTPEFFPMITAVTLARGAVRMAQRHVIVKELAAIQDFGSIDVLCSDKTGTLTSGAVALEGHLDPDGVPAEEVYRLAFICARFESGMLVPTRQAVLAAPRAGRAGGIFDDAILAHDPGDPVGADGRGGSGQAGEDVVHGFRKRDEVPFDFERRRASVVAEELASGRWLLIVKGAPESVLAACTHLASSGGAARVLDAGARGVLDERVAGWSGQGLRVLAVAVREVPPGRASTRSDESGLTLAGFLTFADPPLAEVPRTLEALAEDGVRVVVLTGDHEAVASHVCAQVGLGGPAPLTGNAIDALDDTALAAVAERTTIFARVTPAQKVRILLALKARGHVVGFLGDGINDAPALRHADVGISVAGAADAAQDAADLILMERNLGVLHAGILEGRRAFGNVMKYLLMGTSSNFGNVLSMAVASPFLPFLPMRPTQILLNNFLYDLTQVTIPSDEVDPEFMRKPRRWDVGSIRRVMLRIGPLSSFYDLVTFAVLLLVFRAGASRFQTGWFVESLATQTLVLFVIRTLRRPWHSRPSRLLALTVAGVVAGGVILPYSPFAGALGLEPLPGTVLAFLSGVVVAYLLLVEAVKRPLLAGATGR